MAHVLLGWELGGNRGHALRLADLARTLRARGHRTSFALQRVDALAQADAQGDPVWQAPLTPRLLTSARRPTYGPPTGMGDILARLGMDDPGIVRAMIAAWRTLLGEVRPDLVLADFAPFLLLAARGRVPTVGLGTGFSCPPPQLARFPQLVAHPPCSDQERTLASVNEGLAAGGDALLGSLPEIFAANRAATEDFVELDPYADGRQADLARPVPPDLAEADGSGEEVFVYVPERVDEKSPLWAGLAAARVPVRVHVSGASTGLLNPLAGLGFAVEPEPLPFERIAERSRLLVSHGGHGFVASALAVGLPQVVCHYDLEKLLNGVAVARLDLGGHVSLSAIRPEAFASSLVQLYRDEALAERARTAGEAFRRRKQPSREDVVAEALAGLT